jgi:hypothetical protein
MYRGIFPKDQARPRTVRVRIVGSTSEHTMVQTLDSPREQWRLLTSRIPERWPAGTEVRVTFTAMELEWMQGLRELDSEP